MKEKREDLISECVCLEHEIEKYRFRYILNQLKKMNLYRGDPRLLIEVWRKDGSTQAQLAKTLCVKPPSLTVMLKRMETAGLISRRRDKEDQRITRVYITEKGRKAARKTQETLMEANREIKKGLTDEQIRQYCEILRLLRQNLIDMKEEKDRERMEQND